MIKDVKRFYEMGFAIHLLRPKSKMPVKSKWTTGPRDDFKTILKEYKPGMNVGVRLGRASALAIGEDDCQFLAVIDCDVKSTDAQDHKEMIQKLKEFIDVDAPMVLSGRGNGSAHIYVRTVTPVTPKRLSQSSKKVKVYMPSVNPSRSDTAGLTDAEIKQGLRLRAAWEISLMGEGQQVVLPPSIHPDSKKPYVWSIPLNSISDIPVFTPNAVADEKPSKESSEVKPLNDFKAVPVDLYMTDLPQDVLDLIVDGRGCEDRSASLFKASMQLVRFGFTEIQILSVLTDHSLYLGQAAYSHAKTRSRKAAANWVYKYTLNKATREVRLDAHFDDLDLDSTPLPLRNVDDDWTAEIDRNTNDGAPKHTLQNIKLILAKTMNDKPFVARNEFSIEDTWTQDTPWGCVSGRIIKDDDSITIKEWFGRTYRMEPSKEKIEEVLIWFANQNSFHPVKDFLNGLKWDGTPRIKTWLRDYLHAQGPSEYLSAVGSKTLLAMVGRILEPGCKFDNVLILEGEQGIGKSSTARILAGDKWFSDSDLNIGDKDSVVNMQGVWVYELGELSAMSRFDVNRLKEFVSRSTDKIRPPYGKRTIHYPRQSVFIGTTNNDEYLKDKTGNRRYWPVKIGRVNIKALKRDREQLLAEACERFLMGEEIWISDPVVEKLVQYEQGLRVEHDEIEDRLAEFLENRPEGFPVGDFRTADLFEHANFLNGSKNDRQMQMRLAGALRSLRYEKVVRRMGNITPRFWVKNNP